MKKKKNLEEQPPVPDIVKRKHTHTDPQVIDLDDPYWKDKIPTTIWLERWQLYILQHSESWKGKRSMLIRDFFTELLIENEAATGDLISRRKILMDQLKTVQAKVHGINERLAMKLPDKKKK